LCVELSPHRSLLAHEYSLISIESRDPLLGSYWRIDENARPSLPFPRRYAMLTLHVHSSLQDHSHLVTSSSSPPDLFAVPQSVIDDFLLTPNPVPLGYAQPEMEQSYDSCEAYLHHLHATLTYSPQHQVFQVVQSSFERLDAFKTFLDEQVARILEHPKYPSLPEPLQIRRPNQHINNFVLYRIMSLETLYATQLAAASADAPSSILQAGRMRLWEVLDDLSTLASINMVRYLQSSLASRSSLTCFVISRSRSSLRAPWSSSSLRNASLSR
jgi:hypothetical protein